MVLDSSYNYAGFVQTNDPAQSACNCNTFLGEVNNALEQTATEPLTKTTCDLCAWVKRLAEIVHYGFTSLQATITQTLKSLEDRLFTPIDKISKSIDLLTVEIVKANLQQRLDALQAPKPTTTQITTNGIAEEHEIATETKCPDKLPWNELPKSSVRIGDYYLEFDQVANSLRTSFRADNTKAILGSVIYIGKTWQEVDGFGVAIQVPIVEYQVKCGIFKRLEFQNWRFNNPEDIEENLDDALKAESGTKRTLADIGGINSVINCQDALKAIKGGGGGEFPLATQYLGLRASDGLIYPPAWITDGLKNIPAVGPSLAKAAWEIIVKSIDSIDALFDSFKTSERCNINAAMPAILMKWLHSLMQRFVSIEIPGVEAEANKVINMACPTGLISTQDATQLNVRGFIGNDLWECITRANGDIPDFIDMTKDIYRSYLSPDDIKNLYLRGKVSEEQYKKYLTKLGFDSEIDKDGLVTLAFTTPTISDLIPFMVRDVFDTAVVERYGLHNEFAAKFGGDAEELFRAAGSDRKTALLHWAAHWKNPSNTQLFAMYHRLRGGNNKTGLFKFWDEDGKDLPAPQELTENDIKVDLEDVARVLAINDVSPFWRDRLLAISRPVLTRVDVRRAYDIDAITEQDVYESYRDLGYDDKNAKTLTAFAKKLKEKGDVRRKGRLLPSKITSLFKSSSITKGEALKLLEDSGIDPKDATVTVEQATVEVRAKSKLKCIAAIRKRFLFGDIDEGNLMKLLTDLGLDMDQALDIKTSLKCELAYKHKEATAQQLCEWYSMGLVDREQHIARLIRIGYTKDDAIKIAKTCELKAIEKSEKSKGVVGRPQEERKKREGKNPVEEEALPEKKEEQPKQE